MSETKTVERNCQNCIFNVRPSEQVEEFGQSIGSSMCGAGFGPTEMPMASDAQNHKVGELKAASCDQYSKGEAGEYTSLPEARQALPVVMLPNPKVMSDGRRGNAKTTAGSCLNCAFFVQPREALDAGLWNSGVCAARGIMVLNSNTISAATDCEDKTVGEHRNDLADGVMLMPEYTAAMQVVSAVESFVRTSVAPELYETDGDVTDVDKAKGVRAWRKINNPEGNGSVMLPIFDPEFFDEETRKGIPHTGDDEHPEEYVDHMGLVYRVAVLWMHLDETPALWGVAGTGKTEFYRHMAWLMGLPFHRISVTASTEVEDLAGKMHYEPSRGTYFEYGRIPKAWQSPGVVCLDEPNVGPPDVWQFVRPLTDNSKQLVLDMNNGERVTRNPLAFLGMAMNPAWDVRNSGTAMLADADGSRLMHIFVDMPNEEVEREIILARVALDGFELEKTSLDAIMGIARDLRALSKEESLPITWGVRQQIKVARSLRFFEFPQAYRLAAADYLEPASQEIILDVVKSHSPLQKRTVTDEPTRKRADAPKDTDRARRMKVAPRAGATPPAPPKAPPVAPKSPVTTLVPNISTASNVSVSYNGDPSNPMGLVMSTDSDRTPVGMLRSEIIQTTTEVDPVTGRVTVREEDVRGRVTERVLGIEEMTNLGMIRTSDPIADLRRKLAGGS